MQNRQRELAGRAISINRNLEKQHLTRQMHEKIRRVTNRRKTTQICFLIALVTTLIEYMGELYAGDRVTRPETNDRSGRSITSTELNHRHQNN